MPGFTVEEDAVREIVRRLETIRIVDGYSFDANVIRQRHAEEPQTVDGLVLVLEDGPTRDDSATTQTGHEYLTHRVVIEAYPLAPEDATEPVRSTVSRCRADLIRALGMLDRFGVCDRVKFIGQDDPGDATLDAPACVIAIELRLFTTINDHTVNGRA